MLKKSLKLVVSNKMSTDMAKIQIKSDKITPLGGIFFYIRASNCESLYNDIFALRGWEKVEINNVEMELNSI